MFGSKMKGENNTLGNLSVNHFQTLMKGNRQEMGAF